MKTLAGFILMLSWMTATAQWTNIRSITNNNFTSNCFVLSKDTCFIGGEYGKIYSTRDGGVSWDSSQTVFNSSWVNAIAFTSLTTGYACGGTAFGMHKNIIAKTTDGGHTWDSISSDAFFGYSFNVMSLVSDSEGFFAGDVFVKTLDGGKTFIPIQLPDPASTVTALHFSDKNTGVVALREYLGQSMNRYRLARTTNGGVNWTTVWLDSGITSTFSKLISAMDFTNAANGFAVMTNGTVLQTSDGGAGWSNLAQISDSVQLTGISMSKSSGKGYISGVRISGAHAEGRIYITANNGITWQQAFANTGEGLYSVDIAGDDIAYTSGYRNLFKTTTGGTNFIEKKEGGEQTLLFPNPGSGTIAIGLNSGYRGPSTLKIFNMKGQLVYHDTYQTGTMVDISSCGKGIFFYNLSVNGSNFNGKVLIQ